MKGQYIINDLFHSQLFIKKEEISEKLDNNGKNYINVIFLLVIKIDNFRIKEVINCQKLAFKK